MKLKTLLIGSRKKKIFLISAICAVALLGSLAASGAFSAVGGTATIQVTGANPLIAQAKIDLGNCSVNQAQNGFSCNSTFQLGSVDSIQITISNPTGNPSVNINPACSSGNTTVVTCGSASPTSVAGGSSVQITQPVSAVGAGTTNVQLTFTLS